jgi:hypothetical protein
MSADSTQLGIAGNPHSLSRHGGEPTVDANPHETTHAIRSFQEGSWLGKFRQCQHFGSIGIRQGRYISSRDRAWRARGEHLNAERRFDFHQTRRNHDLRDLCNKHLLARLYQCCQLG